MTIDGLMENMNGGSWAGTACRGGEKFGGPDEQASLLGSCSTTVDWPGGRKTDQGPPASVQHCVVETG